MYSDCLYRVLVKVNNTDSLTDVIKRKILGRKSFNQVLPHPRTVFCWYQVIVRKTV